MCLGIAMAGDVRFLSSHGDPHASCMLLVAVDHTPHASCMLLVAALSLCALIMNTGHGDTV